MASKVLPETPDNLDLVVFLDLLVLVVLLDTLERRVLLVLLVPWASVD